MIAVKEPVGNTALTPRSAVTACAPEPYTRRTSLSRTASEEDVRFMVPTNQSGRPPSRVITGVSEVVRTLPRPGGSPPIS